MTKSAVCYASAALSDIGRKRSSNEDSYGLSAEHGVYLVCDGMGGAAAGEIASSMAVTEVMKRLCARPQGESGEASMEALVDETIRATNAVIFSHARQNPRHRGMGTTLVGLVTSGRRILVFNVGDSRCYRLSSSSLDGAKLQQISRDHSLVADEVSSGRLTLDEARRSPMRNVITRALGTESAVSPDLFALEATPGDIFLLSSDGLTGEVSDELIASTLALDLPLDQLCARLVNAANQAGGRDNVTCLLVRAEGSAQAHRQK